MRIDFTGKTSLIVGGSSGIGEGIKTKFSELGSEVFSISRTEGIDIRNTQQVDSFLHQPTFFPQKISHFQPFSQMVP